MFQKQILQNGLTLLTSPMPGVKSVCAMVMVGAGSRYETKKINGLSHFLEHMAFKGTKKRPSAEAISREIDAVGGEFNAFTSKDHTAFYIKAASCHLDLILDILSDMLTNSLFKAEEIEREKGVIIEEINMYEDTPMRKVGEEFENLMFGDTPMGRDVAGKIDNIRAMRREDFLEYVDSLYKTRNMVVSIAGDISNFDVVGATRESPIVPPKAGQGNGRDRSLQDKIEKYFCNLEDKKVKGFEKFTQSQSSPRLRVHYKKTEQAHLVLGFPSFSIDDPRRYALSVLTTILGGGMSSRLFIQVRERRGLAYYVSASNDYYADCGDFTVSAGVDLKRIDEAILVILDEIYQTTQKSFVETHYCASHAEKQKVVGTANPISIGELVKAKEFIKGHMILGLEDSQSVAGLYASQHILQRKIVTPEEIMAKVEKVTLDDVCAVAKDIFNPARLNLAVIGPFKDEGRFEKLIK